MIIESGCWGCDGGAGNLVRVYRDASGDVRTEGLLNGIASGLPTHIIDNPDGPQEYPAFISGHAMTQDASVMAVSFCIKGSCVFSELGSFEADSEGVTFRSLDGGITWQETGRGGPVYRVDGVLTDGRVLVGHGAQDDGVLDYALLPDNTTVTAPTDGAYPVTISNQILWGTSDGRLLLPDGSEFFSPSEPDPNRYYRSVLGSLSSGLEKGSALVYWYIQGPAPRPDGYVDRFAVAELNVADGLVTLSRQWEIEGYLWTIGSWSSKNDRAIISIQAPGSEYGTPLPAILDLDTGSYSLIPGPFKSDQPGWSSLGRTAVHAVQTGPFARVTGTGSCLNIRTDPSVSAEVLTCMADGVLLRETSDVSAGWMSVITPGGTQGWASLAFLER